MKVKTLITAIVGAALLGFATLPAQAGDSVTMSSWGGSYQEAQRKAFYEPAAATLGITIKEDSTIGIADVRSQVMANAVKWDITEQAAYSCAQLSTEGHLEPLDYSVINTDGLNPAMVTSHWVGYLYNSTVIAWNTEKYGDNGPQTWADFFDTEKFPGSRAMYYKAMYNVESALIADGVPMDKVYETLSTKAGEDRAFAKLNELKEHVAVWWRSGAQSMQLIKDGEVDMISIWNGRIKGAIDDGAKAAFTYNEGIMDFDCLLVPKGAPNKDLAMKVINEFIKPENQANLPKYIPYGPINQKAFETGKITAELAKATNSSPANAKIQLMTDPSFYVGGRFERLQERFDEMVQE